MSKVEEQPLTNNVADMSDTYINYTISYDRRRVAYAETCISGVMGRNALLIDR